MIFTIFMLLFLHFLSFVCKPFSALIRIVKPPRLPPITNSLLKESASSLAEKIRNRKLSSETIVRACIDRIKEVNPFLNAVIEDRFDEALTDAKKCDAILKSGKMTAATLEKEMPLFGIPITVKESLSLNGMSYTGGNFDHKGRKASRNSPAIEMLLNAGAIPLCVTNTSELCCSIHTSNVLAGATNNPYDTRISPGGSSGGEAALLGAGASVLGIGSDLVGSIRIPSLFSGVFGHKPTTGIISGEGHFPFSPDPTFVKLIVVGPIARHAKDLRLVMKIFTSNFNELSRFDEPIDLKTVRVLYIEKMDTIFDIYNTTSDIKEKIKDAARHLRGIGAHVEQLSQEYVKYSHLYMLASICDIQVPDEMNIPNGDKIALMLIEFCKALLGLSKYSAQLVLSTIFTEQNAFLSPKEKQQLNGEKEILREKLNILLDERTVILLPTFTQPASYAEDVVLKTDCTTYAALANIMQFPATHVPMGLNKDGLPVGFQVMAGCKNDHLCLAIAEELERAFGGWVPPPY
ncbi:fatty-acid amide hydrolase 2-B isoform X2 [Megalopta genalis]